MQDRLWTLHPSRFLIGVCHPKAKNMRVKTVKALNVGTEVAFPPRGGGGQIATGALGQRTELIFSTAFFKLWERLRMSSFVG